MCLSRGISPPPPGKPLCLPTLLKPNLGTGAQHLWDAREGLGPLIPQVRVLLTLIPPLAL